MKRNKFYNYSGAAEGCGFDNSEGNGKGLLLFGDGEFTFYGDGEADGMGEWNSKGYCDDSN